ncbi:GTPase-activating protein BEM2/IPL2 [Rhizophagus clarus]|uniref:GTPase-activating protein BEM2/IPL2 n=1 Tax=Rhizophagus clarus TaxID=94130 RepID=A0A8H3M9I3_9GLOM|nr:GTPase-activating protein BEM2/IPL2 [Rhizophagus clarus]
MFKKKQKKSEEQNNQSTSSSNTNRQLAVINNKAANTAINYIITRAPNLIPAVVETAKLIPKLPKKRDKKNKKKDEIINLPSPTSPTFITSPVTLKPPSTKSSKSLNEIEIGGGGNRVSDHQRRPSEPTPVRSNFPPGILSYKNGVPVISVHNVDDGMISPIEHSSNSLSNVNVIKEGYLKKIDFDSKPFLTSRGWKVYKVNLRASKLYFYKPPSEAVLKTFFPNNNNDSSIGKDVQSTSFSPVIANDRGMNLNPSNFDSNAVKFIFESNLITKYYYGEMGYEVDRSVLMRFKKLICLLIFEDNVIICKRKFIRYTTNLRLMGAAIGLGGGNHSSTNVPNSNNNDIDFGGQDIDSKSISSTRGITDNDGNNTNTNKGKGYYTKWKLDTYYPIHSIEVNDPNFQTTYSPYIVPNSLQQPFPSNRINDIETSSLHSTTSSISVAANVPSSSSAILYLNITDGQDKDSYRVFVVPNNEIRSLWEAKLFDAKKKSLRKIMIQEGGSDLSNIPVGSHDQLSYNNDKPDSRKPVRAYWGTDKHPELIIREFNSQQNLDHDNVSATTSPVSPSSPIIGSSLSQRFIRGGLIDSLIHELIFETQKGPNDNNDEFLLAFLLTYPLFTEPNHIFRELRRCGNMQSSLGDDDELKKSKIISKRLCTILFTWCKNYGQDLSRDDVYNGMMEIVDEVLINDDIIESEVLKRLIQETRETTQNIFKDDNNMEDQFKSFKGPSAPLSLDLSNLLVTGLTPALFLKMIPKELAQQLYIYHFLEFKKMNPGQNLKSFIPSKNRSESITCPLNATPATPHFITRLIYHHILTLTQQSAYISRRPLLLTHWIETGIACKSLGDMTGWIAIALAICSPAIVRLKEAWRRVNKHWIDVIISDWVPLLITCGGIDGEIDIENVKSLLLVVQDKKEKNKTKPIPYFGFITLAMERLNSTIPSVIDRSVNDTRVGSRNNSISGTGFVNFEKYWKMYDTLIESLSQCQQIINFDEISEDICPFSPSSPLQKFFHQFNSVPVSSALDTWQSFDSSLSCEPRLHGQYLEHHARQRKPYTAYVPLVFTEVIPTNRLFEKNAFLSASGALGKRASNSSLNIGDNNPSYPTIPSSGRPTPTPLNLESLPASNSKNKPNSPSHLSVQRGVRKRTLSFPPAKIGPLTSTTWNTGLDLVTRNWLGGLVQNRGGAFLLKCMKDIAGVGEMLMFVKDGELVFKSVRDATGSRPASLVENSSGTSSKRNSIHGLVALTQQQNSPRASIYNTDHDALMVVVKAGTLERLVDVLINGVASYSTSVFDDNGEPPLTIGKQGQLGINSEEYLATFFSTYRSFCSPILLLDILRKRFINAKKVSKDEGESRKQVEVSSNPTSDGDTNYVVVGTIQKKVLKVFRYWIAQFFYDFLDDLTLKNRLMHFIEEAKIEVESWSKAVKEESLILLAKEVKDSLNSLKRLVAEKSLKPTYDFQDEKMASLVDRVLNDSYQLSTSDNDNKQNVDDDNIVIPLIDNYEVCDLLDNIDLMVLRLFEAVTPQDWILAYEILETQSADVLGWYPKKQSSSSDDEIIITDIFITLQRTERISNSKENVLISLPRSIKALCRMHNIIRNWIIQEITSPSIECDKRVNRINKLLDMVLLSRRRMAKLDIYPKGEPAKDPESKRGVPSFVESSIVSGLISPESRFFTRAWNDVSQSRSSGLDTLDSLIQSELSKPIEDLHPNFALVPCVGWLFERMLEICCNVPDMSFESEKLINYDKRRYVYNLTQIFVRLQHELTELSREMNSSIDVRHLANTSSHDNTSKSDLRCIKDIAIRENNAIRIANTQSKFKYQKPFNKLISEQQEKVKRDQKERDRLAKDMMREIKHQRPRNKSRVESFIKQVARPLSIFGSPRQSHNSGNFTNIKGQPHFAPSKAALVINLINSVACEASDFGLTLDFVFRIVTEEGGQYLFQALDNDNMNDWIRVINEAAKEGAEKRSTILDKELNILPKEEEVSDEPKTRSSVYGKDLKTLMPDGKIPVFVEKCIIEIEKRGLKEVGIYRVPGADKAVSKLIAAFNKNADIVDLSSEEYRDINIVAGALKRFFRDLPEPVMTYELYDEFIEANAAQDRDEKLYAIKDLLYRLPKPNYELLKRLIEHLERVTDYEETNHMYASNLAIVFGPNLLKSIEFYKSMGNLGHHSSIVKSLILQYHWFFDIEEENEEASEIEYHDDLSDPDIETSEPEGDNEDHQTQENTIATDDDASLIASENEPINEPNYDDLNKLADEFGRHSWEGSDREMIEGSENLQKNLQESLESSSSEQNSNSIILEHKYINIEDIGNRDSTLTDVTEDPEGELELSLQEPENVIHDNIFEENNRESVLTNVTEVSESASIMESVKTEELNVIEVSEDTYVVEPLKNEEQDVTVALENVNIVEPLKNEEQNVTEVSENVESVKNEEQNVIIVSENASMVEPVKNEEQNVTEISENTSIMDSVKNEQDATEVLENVEFVKREEKTKQVNTTLQNLIDTDTVVPMPAIKLNEKFLDKSRYSVNLIDFDSDFETLPQQINMSNTVNEHLMDSIDNYIATLDKPLQPGKFVRQQESVSNVNITTKKDSTIGHNDNLFINNELNTKRNSIGSLNNSLQFVLTDDMDELILKRKSMVYEQELMKDDFNMIAQQEKEETRITQRPSVESVVNGITNIAK